MDDLRERALAIAEKLCFGCVTHERRWSGDTHDDLVGSINEAATDALMLEASQIIAALSAAPQVPEGWVLVPVKPSDSMVGAGCMELADSLGGYESGQVYMCWSAMLAAKPEPKA